jgi:hypothetical protein
MNSSTPIEVVHRIEDWPKRSGDEILERAGTDWHAFVNEGLELGQTVLHTNRGRVVWGPHGRQTRCSP